MLRCSLLSLLWFAVLCCVLSRPLRDKPAVELSAGNFNEELGKLPADHFALVEFFASWCPACRRFAPDYEKVATYFNVELGSETVVLAARVDCAEQVALCGEFKLEAYPTMFLGSGAAFVARNQANITQYPNSNKRTPVEIVSWIAKQVNKPYIYREAAPVDVPSEVTPQVPAVPDNAYKFEVGDVERTTIELMSQATLGLEGPEKRKALETMVQLFADAHPSSSCEQGALKLLDSYHKLWPEGQQAPTEELLHYPICGEDLAKAPPSWVACFDNNTNSRGFTCGVWLLLHSMAARYPADADEAGRHIMGALNALIRHFFKCGPCAEHFAAMLDAQDAKDVVSKRDAVLWLWRAHNKVNTRIGKEGSEAKPDNPSPLPKIQWPTVELCPSCRVPDLQADDHNITWADDEVYAFLLRFYGTSQPVALHHATLSKTPAAGTTVGQFTRSTLLFMAALLAIWYFASVAIRKNKHPYRRNWV